MKETAKTIRDRLAFIESGGHRATGLIMSRETWETVWSEGGAEADGQRAFDGLPVTLFDDAGGVAIAFEVRR